MSSRFNSHQAYILKDGTYVPGSTTVIENLGWNKNVLMGWVRSQCLAGKDPYKVRDNAAEIGTVAHGLVEEHIRESLGMVRFAVIDQDEYAPKLLEVASVAYNSFLEWESLNEVNYASAELQLVSEEYKFGGTIDIVGSVNGKKYVIDLKTSSGVYREHIIQLASYRYLYYENYGETLDAMVLHLDKKNGSFSPHYIPEPKLEAGFKAFTHLRAIHDLKDDL